MTNTRLNPYAIALACLALVGANNTPAADRHVPGDYATIQAAVDAAVSGDTIQIAPGVYVEQTDHLALFTHGVIGVWSVPKKVGRDYVDQMTAEVREEKEDSRGRIKVVWAQKRRDNHYLDCELMIDVAAVISGYLRSSAGTGKE